jgi:hypothetical protein
MGITQQELIREILRLMQNPLMERGYIFSKENFLQWNFGFYKKLDIDLYVYIEFQPDGFSIDDIFDLAVNLIRSATRHLNLPEPPILHNDPVIRFVNRLSPRIYMPGGKETDHWWHFLTIDDVRADLQDIYEKLINFGIPHLEDLTSKDMRFKD